MTTITITLPEDLAEQARKKGLLTSAAIESYVREKLTEADAAATTKTVTPFDPRLEGIVNPAIFGQGTITGDIIGPFHEEWSGSE